VKVDLKYLVILIFVLSASRALASDSWTSGDISHPDRRFSAALAGFAAGHTDNHPSYGGRLALSYQEKFVNDFWAGLEVGASLGSRQYKSLQFLLRGDYRHAERFDLGLGLGFAVVDVLPFSGVADSNHDYNGGHFVAGLRESYWLSPSWRLFTEIAGVFGHWQAIHFLVGISYTF
jgi:hypothetical protein